MDEKKKVRIVKVGDMATLYFCPNCKRGHMVDKFIRECDICKCELDWSEVNEDTES